MELSKIILLFEKLNPLKLVSGYESKAQSSAIFPVTD